MTDANYGTKILGIRARVLVTVSVDKKWLKSKPSTMMSLEKSSGKGKIFIAIIGKNNENKDRHGII